MKRTRKKAFVITKIKPKLVFIKPKKFLGKKIVGAIFLILGSVILTSSFFYFFLIPTFFKNECLQPSGSRKGIEKPERIFIPSLNLDLPVVEGSMVDNQWSLPEGSIASLPGNSFFEEGDTGILYGSNNQKALGAVSTIKKGEKIYLFGVDKFRLFQVAEAKSVLPTEENSLLAGEKNTLILFSTNDYLKGRRFVVKAVLIP